MRLRRWTTLSGVVPDQDNGFREGDHVRRIPFEVMVKGDAEPFYEETLEDAGRFNDQPVLPFNACAPPYCQPCKALPQP